MGDDQIYTVAERHQEERVDFPAAWRLAGQLQPLWVFSADPPSPRRRN
jgi:hypothetical protein